MGSLRTPPPRGTGRLTRTTHSLRDPSLLLRYAGLSLVLVAVLALVLAWQLSSLITERAHLNAQTTGAVTLRVAAQGLLGPEPDLRDVEPADRAVGRQLLSSPELRDVILSATAYLPDGTVVYSSQVEAIGRQEPLGTALGAAFDGETRSEVGQWWRVHNDAFDRGSLGADDRVLVVTTPLSISGDDRPEVAVELTLPYAPVARAVQHDTRVVYTTLALGTGGLYLALFRLVASASGRLRRQSRENRELALHDQLTGLANRGLLRAETGAAVTASSGSGRRVALLLLDLDRFKEVNDTLGHHHGDLLLQRVGPRLHPVLPDDAVVARVGGDEFAVLLPSVADETEAVRVADRVLAALEEPFLVDDVALDVGASIGIAVTDRTGGDFEALLQQADVAMYAAKEDQLGRALYDPDQDVHTPERLSLLGDLRRGIDQGQLVLHYQPKADAGTGAVHGVEALVRWQHPSLGLVMPDSFIPLAENTGLIRPLTLAVLEAALGDARAWADAGRPLTVAVNLSARCLLDLALPHQVAEALARHGVPAERLVLEITESSVMSDPERALAVLRSLATLGAHLSLDDFGTGWSSLSSLQQLPVSELKIDRSFVRELDEEGANRAIVVASLHLARALDLEVVAEGVEDQGTWDALVELGCPTVQGYFLCRPVPAEQLTAWLDAYAPLAGVPAQRGSRG